MRLWSGQMSVKPRISKHAAKAWCVRCVNRAEQIVHISLCSVSVFLLCAAVIEWWRCILGNGVRHWNQSVVICWGGSVGQTDRLIRKLWLDPAHSHPCVCWILSKKFNKPNYTDKVLFCFLFLSPRVLMEVWTPQTLRNRFYTFSFSMLYLTATLNKRRVIKVNNASVQHFPSSSAHFCFHATFIMKGNDSFTQHTTFSYSLLDTIEVITFLPLESFNIIGNY